jgi:formylglycine-generating enzyme required for sulfatase activity
MIWEWCEDFYGEYPESGVQNPKGVLTGGSSRVLRGGSWFFVPRCCRSANRGNYDPTDRDSNYGFRLQVSVQGFSEGS